VPVNRGEGSVRTVGIILVALGAMALGWQGVTYATTERSPDGQVEREKVRTVWVPPLVGGIAVVSGLILLATDNRREDG